jgi:protein-L-isoaspartate(D-aspartate) O-methyltransferase
VRRWAVLLAAVAAAACSLPAAETSLPPITRADAGAAATSLPASSTTEVAAPPATVPAPPPAAAERAEDRQAMVDRQIAARDIDDPIVLEAMRAVPRHRFVPDDYDRHAYSDGALPIGYGQTISQPYIVALMSQALTVQPGDRVLEIGTGSGYQAAVLAAMGLEVYTIEIIPELAMRAEAALEAVGYDVETRTDDGYHGWPEAAPFDAIIVTAAPDHVPQPLVDQLAIDGVMVIPVGPIGAVQTLWRFSIGDDGEVRGENLGAVRFVPFTRAGE